MPPDPFQSDVSQYIWNSKYRYCDDEGPVDETLDDTWHRVARGIAGIEPHRQSDWTSRFLNIQRGFRFLPGGRILAGTGVPYDVTLFNCFVMGRIEDSLEAIFDALKEGALTMQQGGGVGYDFSTLRPRGFPARRVGSIASGPVSFMRIWDAACDTLISTGARRGAMMASLRCDHPDIERFIDAKRHPGELRHFNLSVQVNDDFMQAVDRDDAWPLVFPVRALQGNDQCSDDVVQRVWSDRHQTEPCRILRRVRARDLWERIMRATYEYAEPGVLFIDSINRMNNLAYRERISATNPCGEVPLPTYGACNLGSLNLTTFVKQPFTQRAQLDLHTLDETTTDAVRFLDNVVDLSRFPLEAQRQQAQGTRRIGLGMTGLADTLMMLGLNYGHEEARHQAAKVMAQICHTAYRASIELAKEKGAFPYFNQADYLHSPFIRALPDEIQQGIEKHGIRNSHLTAVAPTGTISLFANTTSSGLEPVFDFYYRRKILQPDGKYQTYTLTDYAWRLWQTVCPGKPRPDYFVDCNTLTPDDHLLMQAALQPYVDNAISKTINVPADYPFEQFKSLYKRAYVLGLKGCTTFRPNPVTGEILSVEPDISHHCCSIEREAG
ncbi:MAG: adenosylcobalamin-dependent ribonucleoside-diphosphate reductase [Candidatus Thiodiazotropha sp. (ex Lucina pensylvanica)]|nr:adenosylcobalamin-dependent ribonucleoside-diphosphate reductase [Candidatus Thiodiazotropha sp. (ex Lucina pensylvanica)]MBT3049342.1 adenosylcobalamin-dependent ribonucleoside-diphosphate reductase [Candidatus Thiodiazotropha sp. (ex Codakia orbicularis)]